MQLNLPFLLTLGFSRLTLYRYRHYRANTSNLINMIVYFQAIVFFILILVKHKETLKQLPYFLHILNKLHQHSFLISLKPTGNKIFQTKRMLWGF